MKTQSVILLMGGNLGQVEKTIDSAIQLIDKILGRVKASSSFYSTKAWGPIPQNDFLNKAILIETIYPPQFVLQSILQIEKSFGRQREIKYGPRTLDIDILFYGRMVIHTNHLIVPHPEIQNRRFALVPLAEIHVNFKHPVFNKTIKELLNSCDDVLEVKKIEI